MSLRHYLFIMSLATLFCWLSWAIVIVSLDPFVSGTMGFAFFYASLFLSLLGTVSLVTFFFLHLFFPASPMLFQRVKISFLSGCMVAGVSAGLLFLQGIDVLARWNTAVFFLMLAFLLFFVLSLKKRNAAMTSFSDPQ